MSKRQRLIFPFLLASLQLMLFFTNCSGSKFSSNYSTPSTNNVVEDLDKDDDDDDTIDDPVEPIEGLLVKDGTTEIFQDIPFSLQATETNFSNYTKSGIPTWVTYNSASGKITGTPLVSNYDFSFSVTNSQTTYGPYNIKVMGNPLKIHQWYLTNTGQNAFAYSYGTSGEDIKTQKTIASGYTGSGTKIAVSDSGVYVEHETLKSNISLADSRNYLNDYTSLSSWIGDPTPSLDEAGDAHGTGVASLIAATGWNNVGMRGVAPKAKVSGFLYLPAQDKLIDNDLLGVAHNDQFSGNFDIFNYSWGYDQCSYYAESSSLFTKVKSGVTNQRGGLGSIYVMAGGNDFITNIQNCYSDETSKAVLGNSNMSDINTTPYIISVAALDAKGISASYSTPGSNLWISAPGGESGYSVSTEYPEDGTPGVIMADYPGCTKGQKTLGDAELSTFNAGTATENSSCNYAIAAGSSFASPIVAGAVALMLEAKPSLTWRDVKYILAKTADKINSGANPVNHPISSRNLSGHKYDHGWVTNAAGFNFQNYYGFGRLNVDKAVDMAKNYSSPLGTLKDTNWKHASQSLNVSITDNSATGITRSMIVSEAYTLEAVQLKITIAAPTSPSTCSVSDIGLEITSPSGTKSVVMNINSGVVDKGLDNHTFLSNAFYGEKSNGQWYLKIVDAKAGCVSSLKNWKLNFLGY